MYLDIWLPVRRQEFPPAETRMWTPGLSGVQGGLMRASRRLNGNTPWGDPVCPPIFWGNCWRVMHMSYSPNSCQTIHCPKKSAGKKNTDGQGAGSLPPSPRRRDGRGLTALLPRASHRWSQRGSMTCAATVLRCVYPHHSAF